MLATIARRPNWLRLYEGRVWAKVVSVPYYGRFYETDDTVRATWAARAASVAWLSNQSGRAKARRDLALRTDSFIARSLKAGVQRA